ncbi:protein Tob1-like isoform X1 [Lates japonicus]|uniref:Protein Tob1-like isoform X1 n=1 Tax=Lates japonicus TaxID=270547 RepID=A0AAD3MMW0_LATJO|nr:protein Tob1-like isoform X1 [Lates japonicus]
MFAKGSGFSNHRGEKVDPVRLEFDPIEVSYQIGEKGPVKVLYVDDNNENGSELDKEIKNSFNPEAQVFMPISDPVGASSESSPPLRSGSRP